MPELKELIAWSGSSAVLSLFTVVRSAPEREPTMAAAGYAPNEVRRYEMEHSADKGPGFDVVEYDARFDAVPDGLSEYIAGCLSEALRCGAVVAWFGFEGSFHFDHLLTPDVAAQVYGVADAAGVALVSESAQLAAEGWTQRIATAKEHLP